MNKFWDKVMPACIAEFDWGKTVVAKTEAQWEKSLKKVFSTMDDGEFNVFLAKMVIRASGSGLQGAELTERVVWFKKLRQA